MKSKNWNDEIQKLLSQKVQVSIEKHREARSLAIDELSNLNQQLEDLEKRMKTLSSESAGLNLLRNEDLAKKSENDRSLFSLEKHTREIRKQINDKTEKLTVIPAAIAEGPWLNFLLQLKKEKL